MVIEDLKLDQFSLTLDCTPTMLRSETDDTTILDSGCTSNVLSAQLLIPQARPAHKYPNSPWEMIHPPGGDNAVCM
jgi:hypothetical protein